MNAFLNKKDNTKMFFQEITIFLPEVLRGIKGSNIILDRDILYWEVIDENLSQRVFVSHKEDPLNISEVSFFEVSHNSPDHCVKFTISVNHEKIPVEALSA